MRDRGVIRSGVMAPIVEVGLRGVLHSLGLGALLLLLGGVHMILQGFNVIIVTS